MMREPSVLYPPHLVKAGMCSFHFLPGKSGNWFINIEIVESRKRSEKQYLTAAIQPDTTYVVPFSLDAQMEVLYNISSKMRALSKSNQIAADLYDRHFRRFFETNNF